MPDLLEEKVLSYNPAAGTTRSGSTWSEYWWQAPVHELVIRLPSTSKAYEPIYHKK